MLIWRIQEVQLTKDVNACVDEKKMVW